MRVKVVPEPPDDPAALGTVRGALPRVPRPEADCCRRIAERVAWIDDREAAREWLVFLRALGLARRCPSGGYARGDSPPRDPGINSIGVGYPDSRTGAPDDRGGANHSAPAESRAPKSEGNGDEGADSAGSRCETPASEVGAAGAGPEPNGRQAEADDRSDHDAEARTYVGGGRECREDPGATIARRFLEGVLGAREIVAALGEEPQDAEVTFEAVRGVVPTWERRRPGDWVATWQARTERLLGWATVLGLAEPRYGGYVATSAGPGPDRPG